MMRMTNDEFQVTTRSPLIAILEKMQYPHSYILKYAYQTIKMIVRLGVSPEDMTRMLNEVITEMVMSE